MPHQSVPQVNRRHARRMRKAMTDAELKFWNAVRAHRLMGLSFRRQLPIAGYIVDFACPEHKLVVEIDGSTHSHDDEIIRDKARDERLSMLGWRVIRVTNDEAMCHLDDVCTHIMRAISWKSPD